MAQKEYKTTGFIYVIDKKDKQLNIDKNKTINPLNIKQIPKNILSHVSSLINSKILSFNM